MAFLQPIVPRDSYTLWYSPTHLIHPSYGNDSSPSLQYLSQQQPNSGSHVNTSQATAHTYNARSITPGGLNGADTATSTQARRYNAHASDNTPSTRAQHQQPFSQSTRLLSLDEAALESRKALVRRFGATWIRPPGVPKTLQAMVDEAVEKAEQEAASARELAWAEEREAVRQAGDGGFDGAGDEFQGGAEGEQGEEMGMERDLDEEVPEAEEGEGEDDESVYEDQDDNGDEDEQGMDLVNEDDEAMTTQDNFDDSIPEAGSFEHTDTELDSGDESALSPSFTRPTRPTNNPPQNATTPDTSAAQPSAAPHRQNPRPVNQAQARQPQAHHTPPPNRPLFTVMQGVPGAPPPQPRFGDSFAGSPSQALEDSLVGDVESSMVEENSPSAAVRGRGTRLFREGWRRSPRSQGERDSL